MAPFVLLFSLEHRCDIGLAEINTRAVRTRFARRARDLKIDGQQHLQQISVQPQVRIAWIIFTSSGRNERGQRQRRIGEPLLSLGSAAKRRSSPQHTDTIPPCIYAPWSQHPVHTPDYNPMTLEVQAAVLSDL